MMQHDQIISNDFRKNHAGREYDEPFVHDVFKKYKDIGGALFESQNVLTFYQPIDGGVEFHCMNGGSGKDLTEAINDFLTSVCEKYEKAFTYYDNPRINDLVRYSKFPASIQKIDDGIDRTYEMSFDLRSEKWAQ